MLSVTGFKLTLQYEGVYYMKTKRIISLVLSAVLMRSCVFASVLGNETVSSSSINIAEGAKLFTNSFYSDQSGVGRQTENYVEYTPNTTAVPVIVNDWYLYGKRTVSQMSSALMSAGLYPVMLMNSDFFSFQTGVPMSHQVENGVLVTKDSTGMDAIGINGDGTAFISWLQINIAITVGEQTISIDNFNKYRQPYVIYMLDDKFSDTTQASDPGLNVIIGSLSGDLTLGSSVTGVVEGVVKSDGAIEIPKGKIVLTADDRVPPEVYEQLSLFKEGDEVTINTTADGDERWNNAKYILGCLGGRLIKDGEIQNVDEAAAPRTAFGIKADGTLVFYTIDGRQSGHSYGVRLNTLAQRLKELGCVDAVNLDGGGSTSIGTVYPGNDSFSVINKPSDGSLRKVATFIGIYNSAQRTGAADKLFLYPYGGNYLSGATEYFSALATDSGYYKAPVPQTLVYTAPDGTTSSDGSVRITGNGEVTVRVSGDGINGSATVNCYESPDAITVYNQDTNNAVNTLSVSCLDSVNLTASASIGHKQLIADDSCFEWRCVSTSGNIGTVDTNGYFTAGDENAQGYIEVSAGGTVQKISVSVTAGSESYTDISFEETAPGQLKISFLNTKGIGLKDENVIVRADGQPVSTSIENNSVNLVFGDSLSHKISVTATNNAGLVSAAYHTLSGNAYKNIFADTSSHWARDYISYMNCYGIVNGTVEGSETYFRPSAGVTRAEFAVMVANLMGTDTDSYSSSSLKVSDASSVPSWAANHIKALCEMGIMQGRQSGDEVVFDPSASLTRAEAVTVISRIAAVGVRVQSAHFTDSDLIPSWARSAFDRLYTLKIIGGYEDGSIRPLGSITRAEAIKMLYEIY